MKVIFLDIDGVLLVGLREFDRKAKQLFLRLIEETGAKVVISSSWACDGIGSVLKLFSANGIDLKPLLHKDWTIDQEQERDTGISKWLACHECAKYVVIDDIPVAIDNLVRVDQSVGFSDADYDLAVAILGK